MNSNVDVFRNIRVIITISRIWGLVPCTVGGKFKKIVHFVYSLTVTFLFIYVCITFNVFTYQRIGRAATNIKLLIKIIYVETTLRCVLLLAILLVNLMKCHAFVRISAKFATFDQLLKRKLHLELPANENFTFQCLYAAYIVFFGIYYCAQLYIGQNGLGLSIQWALLSNVYLIILAQFTILVRAFHTRFKLFNEFFANVNVLPLVRSDNSRTYVDRLGHVAAFRGRNLNMLNQYKVKELHIIYLSMRDLLHEINSYYSFQILSIVCETVAILIASLSNVTFNIMGDDFSSKASGHMLTLLHCALRLLSITLMVHVAEGTAAEVSIDCFCSSVCGTSSVFVLDPSTHIVCKI